LNEKSNYNKIHMLDFFFNFKMNNLFDVVKISLSLKFKVDRLNITLVSII